MCILKSPLHHLLFQFILLFLSLARPHTHTLEKKKNYVSANVSLSSSISSILKSMYVLLIVHQKFFIVTTRN
jgi:CRISPR/Cas system endoribonuclease Cas6 (RAMP superfamily)